jgi:hypothetical protein
MLLYIILAKSQGTVSSVDREMSLYASVKIAHLV